MKKVCFCGDPNCKPRIARIRKNKLWVKIGIYHTKCRGFSPILPEKTQPLEVYPTECIPEMPSTSELFSDSECMPQNDSFTIN